MVEYPDRVGDIEYLLEGHVVNIGLHNAHVLKIFGHSVGHLNRFS